MSITAAEIQKQIAAEDDFGHELRVGAVMRSIAGAKVKHGATYTDAITSKPRQFDFRCWLKNDTTQLALAVECKNLNPDYPLVVCGVKRSYEEAFHEIIVASGAGRNFGAAHSRTTRAVSRESFYAPGAFVGKTTPRFKPESKATPSKAKPPPVLEKDSEIYDKWAQALSSAVELVEMACAAASIEETVWSAILPVVVVANDSLWKLAYDENGQIESAPEKVDRCEFFVGRQIAVGMPPMFHSFTFSHIHFFTLAGFGSFLSRMVSDKATWDSLLNPSLTLNQHA